MSTKKESNFGHSLIMSSSKAVATAIDSEISRELASRDKTFTGAGEMLPTELRSRSSDMQTAINAAMYGTSNAISRGKGKRHFRFFFINSLSLSRFPPTAIFICIYIEISHCSRVSLSLSLCDMRIKNNDDVATDAERTYFESFF